MHNDLMELTFVQLRNTKATFFEGGFFYSCLLGTLELLTS